MTALEDQDKSSPAYQAWEWIETSAAFTDQKALENLASAEQTKEKLDVTQRFALASMYNSLPNNQLNQGWMTEDDVCDWEGIVCNGANDQGARMMRDLQGDDLSQFEITAISLHRKGLEGPIAPELVMLENLKMIELFSNRLSGEVPEEIYSLPGVEIIDLYDNALTGTISDKI